MSMKISTLQKGLIFDMPLTSDWTQSSTVALDRSANRNHGTATGTPPTFGVEGVDLNGSSDYIDCGDKDIFSFTDGAGNDLPFSVSYWAKMDDATKFRAVVKDYTSSTNGEWFFETRPSDQLSFTLYISGRSAYIGREVSSVTNLEGTWHHFVGTYDGNESSTGIEIYIDGVASSNQNNNSGSYTGMSNTTESLYIGKQAATFANGKISNVKLWNRELTQAEITELYNRERENYAKKISSLMKGLRFHAPLTDIHLQSSVLASDVSAHHNHGTDTNGTPTYSSVGMNCNDNSSIGFGMPDRDWLVPNNVWSIAFRFRPNFATGDDVTEQMWDTSFLGGGNRNGVGKRNNSESNVMRVHITSVAIDIAEATYSPYWNVGVENTLVMTADTDTNLVNAWLNGGQILDDQSASIGLPDINVLWVGSDFNDGTHFDGFIRDFRVWDRIITAAERAEYDASGGVNNSGVAVQSISSLEKGLVLNIPCTDTWLQSSTIASDRSPSRINFPVDAGAPVFSSDGVFGNGDDILTANVNGFRSSDSSGTFSAWVKTVTSTNSTIFSLTDDSGSGEQVRFSWLASGGPLFDFIVTSGGAALSRVRLTGVSTGIWYHYTITSNGSRFLLYINGASTEFTVPTGSDDGSWFSSVSSIDSVSILGTNISGSPGNYYRGQVSGVKVWNRELSAAEVLELYSKGRSY